MAKQVQDLETDTPGSRTLQSALATYLSQWYHVRWDDSAERTAERIVAAMEEFLTPKPAPDATLFPATTTQMVVVKDISFISCCAHHLYPFYGTASFGYLPQDKMIGLSKVPRIVRWMADTPTTQETLTENLSEYFWDILRPQGLGIVIEAEHTCCTCRGVRATGVRMATSSMYGLFRMEARVRSEFLEMIK